MTPPIEHHHVCAACGKPYAATPIQCECGGREFVPIELAVGGTSAGAAVREPKPKREPQTRECGCVVDGFTLQACERHRKR